MTLARMVAALDAIEERTWCTGTCAMTEPFAIQLPDGDVAALADPGFVAWLGEHGEAAPFGDGKRTRRDDRVRTTTRLRARGSARVVGFEPAQVLGDVEAALSPRRRLDAKLTDVLVYPVGGKFARHKDTPREPRLVGTLVVVLPVAHDGGTFVVRDEARVEMRGAAAGEVRWVAVLGDVDHEIEPVTAGTRVLLTYALLETDVPRDDAAWPARRAGLAAGAAEPADTPRWPIMIPCARQVIVDATAAQPQSIDALRGVDRELADVLREAGYDVAVRACMMTDRGDDLEDEDRDDDGGVVGAGRPTRCPPIEWSATRLARAIPEDAIAALGDAVTFDDDPAREDMDGEPLEVTTLAPYVLDTIHHAQWAVRANASATAIREVLFSGTGYFGNEASMQYLYMLVALEVTRR